MNVVYVRSKSGFISKHGVFQGHNGDNPNWIENPKEFQCHEFAASRFEKGAEYVIGSNDLSSSEIEQMFNGASLKYIVGEPYTLFRYMNYESDGPAQFDSYTLAELNEEFGTEYTSIEQAIDADPMYLFTAEDIERWNSEEEF